MTAPTKSVPTMPAPTMPPASQQMGAWMTAALVVGTMIGSGIFLLPVSLAPLGRNALIGWTLSGLGATTIAFALARLTMHGGGGIQAHLERNFGPTVAYLVTWSFWCSNWAASAALAVATAAAVAWLDPAFLPVDRFIAVAVGSVVILQLVNALGARASGGMSIVTTAIKLLPLVAVMVAAGLRGASGTLQPLAPVPVTLANVGLAVALTLFALTGFENGTAPVEKVRNPSRTLPIAILGGTAFVAILYLLSSYAVLKLLPASVVAHSSAPFADAISALWGNAAAVVVAATVAVAAFGALNAMVLATGELGYSMAIRGDFPALFARTRGANTPVAAQLLGSAFAILLILANASRETANLFSFVILLSTASVLVLYLVGALAAWKENPAPGTRAILVLALAFTLFAFWGAGAEADGWGLVLLAIGFALRIVMRRLNSRASIPVMAPVPAAPPESAA
jgi:APA family basic amino acid/polyamine antiporter